MASHRHNPSSSSSTSSDNTSAAGGLLDDHDPLLNAKDFSLNSHIFDPEKQMAHRAFTVSHWARAALAKLPKPRRPTRILATIILSFTLILFFRQWWWNAAVSQFALRGHHIPNNIWQLVPIVHACEGSDTLARFAPEASLSTQKQH